jgi:hypothetical protein
MKQFEFELACDAVVVVHDTHTCMKTAIAAVVELYLHRDIYQNFYANTLHLRVLREPHKQYQPCPPPSTSD